MVAFYLGFELPVPTLPPFSLITQSLSSAPFSCLHPFSMVDLSQHLPLGCPCSETLVELASLMGPTGLPLEPRVGLQAGDWHWAVPTLHLIPWV